MSTDKNTRIAKNTLYLYIRMLLIMLVSLYSSRVILHALGVIDYGLYNVVGGVVSMLSFMTSALGASSSRFITFELGKGQTSNIKSVFRCAVTIHYLLAIILLLLSETLGLWFVVEKMIIPENRMFAALCVFQCSVLTFIVSILCVPYNALIIAHERMNAFAMISVIEALLKLSIAYILCLHLFDSLIVYAILLLLLQVSICLVYIIYCKRNFSETSAKCLWKKDISLEMAKYGGWKINGYLAWMGVTQGINILLNLFFGPAVNAARAISVQVQGTIAQFFGNFQMALNPQITKSYAQSDFNYMHTLMINSSRYSYYLILFIALPIFINIDYLLELWLGEVPEHTTNFVKLMILVSMNDSLRNPVLIAIQATGNIKKFQLIESTILLCVVPFSYIFLKYGHVSPEFVYIIYLIIEIITQIIRVLIVYPLIKLEIKRYFTDIIYPLVKVSVPLLCVTYLTYRHFMSTTIVELFISCSFYFILTVFIIYICGLSSFERNFLKVKIKKIIS